MKNRLVIMAGSVTVICLLALSMFLLPSESVAQHSNQFQLTHRDVAYGSHERNVVDFYQAESIQPTPVIVYFHGGGFTHGDKGGINERMYNLCMENGISLAAANYRFTDTAQYPAQMHDCARAIQFLRSKAKEWNIDASRVAAFGGSAGAGISLWLAFHDDMADPTAIDPVLRQSTRLSSACGYQAQCAYDPRMVREIVPGGAYNHGALKLLFGVPRDWNWDTAEIGRNLSDLMKDASPITHLTKDDSPIFLYHREEQDIPGNIHHANMGRHLKKEMDKIDIECVRTMSTEFGDEKLNKHYEAGFRFMLKHFAK